jgi:hypothetical protein
MLQVTPELLAQIDGIIGDTVAEALEGQQKAATTRQGLERSRNFWRNTAITSCAVLAAGICTEILIW